MSKHAVIYDRASTIGQADNWSRQDAQRVGADLAEKHGYTWELRQEVRSGERLENRLVMLGILDDIADGAVQAIIVQDFTRLSRDRDGMDGRVIRKVCRENGCKVVTPSKTYDFSLDADDDMADFEFLVGKIHKRQSVKAMVRGMREKARQGRHLTGFTLMGYERIYETSENGTKEKPVSRLVINEAEAEIVRVLFREYLKEQSSRATAEWLNEHGYRKPVKSAKMRKRYDLGKSRLFNRKDVIHTIRNPLYAGWVTWGRNCTSPHMRDFEAQWHYRPELQIVSQDAWDRANATRKRNKAAPPRAATSDYAFSMLLACSDCGGGLNGTNVKKRGRRHKRYRCEKKNRSGVTACDGPTAIYETVIARAVIALAAELLNESLRLEDIVREAALEMSRNTDEVLEQAWRAELAEVERETQNLVRAVAKGILSDEQAKRQSAELADQKLRLGRNLTKLGEKAEVRRELMGAIAKIGDDVESVLWLYFDTRPTTLNRILRLIFAPRSVTVEAWGHSASRKSRVTHYELTEDFADLVRVCSGQGIGLPYQCPKAAPAPRDLG
jgi:site-specific DNA recombinase